MIQKIRLTLTLVCLWLLLSGHFDITLLTLGFMSVALVLWLTFRMRLTEHAGQPVYFRFTGILGYWGWLLAQILLSNIDVTRRVWRRQLDIKPTMRAVQATPDTEMGRVVYANSITLTPGTTTISFTPDNHILVHALHEDGLVDLEKGEMADRIRRVETAFCYEATRP